MSRIPPRELFLLTAPVAFIAIVGFLTARRPLPPVPVPTPAHGPILKFSAQTPTVLEAFDGTDTAFVVDYTPPAPSYAAGVPTPTPLPFPLNGYEVGALLEIQRKGKGQGVEVTHFNGYDSEPQVWNGLLNSSRFRMRLQSIPSTASLVFGFTAKPFDFGGNSAANATLPTLSQKWKVDRTEAKPFDFDRLPRPPLVTLLYVRVTENSRLRVQGEFLFRLDDPKMNETTPFAMDLDSEGKYVGGAGWGSGLDTSRPNFRLCQWDVSKKRDGTTASPWPLRIAGRVSAGNRWPLGFTIGPFDLNTVKKGDKLKFSAAPEPKPKP
jgi:hypothetical protein